MIAGASENLRAPGLHHGASMGLLLVTYLYHIHFAFQSKMLAGKAERAAPLAGSGLSIYLLGSGFFIEISRGNRCVGFMASGRTDPLVLEIDLGRRAKQVVLAQVGSQARQMAKVKQFMQNTLSLS